ncbi:MAG: hypothetical protein EOP05_18985 [Proteobacteria bacterium]|nr:MAG: hypothetical protein EOP05_18985 [Pseudomonadota bacterium]
MLWKGRRESGNVVDQRSFGAGKLGGGALVIGAIIYYFMGGNPLVYLAQNAGSVQQAPVQNTAEDDQRKGFASVVLADTEDVWNAQFQKVGKSYPAPKMILFRGRVETDCGRGTSSSGPFYCPADRQVYLDLSFFDEMKEKLGAGGDFAQAYVIAHEVGHHVQTVLGLDRRAEGAGGSKNAASVQIELQADCLAGVWAKDTQQAKNVLEEGDLEEAMNAASAVGDDRLQKMGQGYVVPDSFTHGSSAQRMAAFQKGFSGGELNSCLN